MGLGGPVWHASVKFLPNNSNRWDRSPGTLPLLESQARRVLYGVGEASRGEWSERGGWEFFHLRRRLSTEEELLVGPVMDIRGTPEAERRRARVLVARPDLVDLIPKE